jgi:hypothetical protein
MKRLFYLKNVVNGQHSDYYENKMMAKAERNKRNGTTRHDDGTVTQNIYPWQIKRGPDHEDGATS